MTLEQLQTRLQAYLAAEAKILTGQEYQIGSGSTARRLQRADLAEVRAEISNLNAQIAAASQTTRRVFYLR